MVAFVKYLCRYPNSSKYFKTFKEFVFIALKITVPPDTNNIHCKTYFYKRSITLSVQTTVLSLKSLPDNLQVEGVDEKSSTIDNTYIMK